MYRLSLVNVFDTLLYSSFFHTFQAKAMFREIDSANDLTFMRLRTKKHEIMVAPDRDYLLLVVQNTQETWIEEMKTIKLSIKKYPIPNKTNTEIDFFKMQSDFSLYNMASLLTYLLVFSMEYNKVISILFLVFINCFFR